MIPLAAAQMPIVLPEQPGDVPQTWADISRAEKRLSYEPQVELREGIRKFLTSMEVTSA